MKISRWLFLVLFTIGIVFNAFTQSRTDGLNAEDIYSIRIIQQSDMGFTDERSISFKEDIERIVYYLKKYDYTDFGMEEINGINDHQNDWKYRIIFNGWRDEIYIFNDKVFIGKSAFKLPPGMIREFDRIFRDL